MISDEKLKQFQQMYKKRFGKDLNAEEALVLGEKLIELTRLIYKPIKK